MAITNRKKYMTATGLFVFAGAMVGLAYASAPLYALFCKITGYGGTPVTEARAVTSGASVSDTFITVRFDANTNKSLPWRFRPVAKDVRARLGENVLAFYEAENISDQTITGTASFNVTPYKTGPYFNKVDCFCFTEQTLAPGEKVVMPVTFYVDPEIVNDANVREVKTITLSYTFYRIRTDSDEAQQDTNKKLVALPDAGSNDRQDRNNL